MFLSFPQNGHLTRSCFLKRLQRTGWISPVKDIHPGQIKYVTLNKAIVVILLYKYSRRSKLGNQLIHISFFVSFSIYTDNNP